MMVMIPWWSCCCPQERFEAALSALSLCKVSAPAHGQCQERDDIDDNFHDNDNDDKNNNNAGDNNDVSSFIIIMVMNDDDENDSYCEKQ